MHTVMLRKNMQIDFYDVPRWYVKLWRWLKRSVLRIQPPPPKLSQRIVRIDHESRTVTIA
jgi:hypothetical protein